jgi:CRISPR-associated protein Csd2
MSTMGPVVIFKHVGTDSNLDQRISQARLGCAPAHTLFDLVTVKLKDNVALPRSHGDYVLDVAMSRLPTGIEVGFAMPDIAGAAISWGKKPNGTEWLMLH